MDINASKNFINNHKDKVIGLFLTYQMIELLLFLKLHLPDIPKMADRENALEVINKEMSLKTLGKLKKKYLKKFPKDDYDLISSLEIVSRQRNTFMHSLWIFMALWQDKGKTTVNMGEEILNEYDKDAGAFLNKLYKLPA